MGGRDSEDKERKYSTKIKSQSDLNQHQSQRVSHTRDDTNRSMGPPQCLSRSNSTSSNNNSNDHNAKSQSTVASTSTSTSTLTDFKIPSNLNIEKLLQDFIRKHKQKNKKDTDKNTNNKITTEETTKSDEPFSNFSDAHRRLLSDGIEAMFYHGALKAAKRSYDTVVRQRMANQTEGGKCDKHLDDRQPTSSVDDVDDNTDDKNDSKEGVAGNDSKIVSQSRNGKGGKDGKGASSRNGMGVDDNEGDTIKSTSA